MKITLRFSLIVNGILAVMLLIVGFFALRKSWLFAAYRDGRPEGPRVTLLHDYPVYERVNGEIKVAFTLPRGTALQESTPQGAATLGKHYGREYILIIRSYDSSFHPPAHEKELGWMSNYQFDITK